MNGMSKSLAVKIAEEYQSRYPADSIKFATVGELNPYVANETWADVPVIEIEWQVNGRSQSMSINVSAESLKYWNEDFEQLIEIVCRDRETERGKPIKLDL